MPINNEDVADAFVRLGPVTRRLGQLRRTFERLTPAQRSSAKGRIAEAKLNECDEAARPIYSTMAQVIDFGVRSGIATIPQCRFRYDFGTDDGLSGYTVWIFIAGAIALPLATAAAGVILGVTAVVASAPLLVSLVGSLVLSIGALVSEASEVEISTDNRDGRGGVLTRNNPLSTNNINAAAGIGLIVLIGLGLVLFVPAFTNQRRRRT